MARQDGGHYDRIPSTELGLDLDPPKPIWKCKQIESTSEPIAIKEGRIARWVPDQDFPDVYVNGRVHRIAGQWIVTLFHVNGQQEPRQLKDAAWVFQPELVVEAPDEESIFIRRMTVRTNTKNTCSSARTPPPY